MKKRALIAVFLLAAGPVAAQVAPRSNGQQELGGQGGQSAPSQSPTTGVFCTEEMTATFCNLPGRPNTGGYGSSVTTSGTSSMPPCASGTPANELCD